MYTAFQMKKNMPTMLLHSVGAMMKQSAVRFHSQCLNRQDAHLKCQYQYTSLGQALKSLAQPSTSLIVSPHALGWWHHWIYVAWSSTIYGILTLIHHYYFHPTICFNSICFHLSHPPANHIISSFLQAQPSSTCLMTSAWCMVPIIVERRCGMR